MRPYTYGDYSLYSRDVVLKNGNGTQRIFFFSKHEPKSGAPTSLPRGYKVEVSTRTGMPYIKKDPTAAQGSFGWLKRYFN
jgi:hypothetical protein